MSVLVEVIDEVLGPVGFRPPPEQKYPEQDYVPNRSFNRSLGPPIVCGKAARNRLVAENDRDNGDVIFLPETTSGVGNFGGG